MNTTDKLTELKNLLAGNRVIIALSGGVDSSVMAKLALDLLGYDQVLAATASSEIMATTELDSAREMARIIGIKHTMLSTSSLEDPNLVANPIDRCYHCKHHLYQLLLDYAGEQGYTMVVDGTNLSDQGDYRPGIRALQELGIVSPFKVCGITKEEIRCLAQNYSFPNWNRPSNACLASRFPYGTPITHLDLQRVEAGESILHNYGFDNCRLRHHGDTARIEIIPAQLHAILAPSTRLELVKRLKELGYKYIAIDLEGYRTGSLNEVLP